MVIKSYRVVYYLKIGRNEDLAMVVNPQVLAATEMQALREGLSDPMILYHLRKHQCRLVEWEIEEI